MLPWLRRHRALLCASGAIVLGYGLYRAVSYEADAAARSGSSFEEALAAMPGKLAALQQLQQHQAGGARPAAAAAHKVTFYPPPDSADAPAAAVPIVVLYGTEYGFSKEVAERLCGELVAASQEWGWRPWPRLASMEHGEVLQLEAERLLLLACSTQGDGVPPAAAQPFFDLLEQRQQAGPGGRLQGLLFSVLALGDKSYPHFCRAGRRLDSQLAQLGARRVAPRRDVDLEDAAAIAAWLADLHAALPAALGPAPPLAAPADDYLWALQQAGALALHEAPLGSRRRPFMATLLSRRALTSAGSGGEKDDQEEDERVTFEVELYLAGSGLQYTPGDAFSVVPRNDPALVARVLAQLAPADPAAPVPVPAQHAARAPGGTLPLAEALAACYELRALRPELLAELLAAAAPDPHADRERLQALVGSAEAAAGYLRARELDDVLADFAAFARPPLARLLGALRALQARAYSIASAQAVAGDRVLLAVALVRYRSLGRPRRGVASAQLWERVAPGEALPVFLSPNRLFRLPADGRLPIVMIGPGTGVAPFRAFLQQRLAQAAPGPNVLYFGCRHRLRDYLYRVELEQWAAQGRLELHTAFSRDQAAKCYVQHRIAETGARLWALLAAGAHLYVCGDARAMAGDVHAALAQVVEREGGVARPEAFLAKLEAAGRYQRDVWF